MTDPLTAGREPVDLESLLDRAVAGVPRWRRDRTRRELAGYVEDAYTDLLTDGLAPAEARRVLRARFGSPDLIAAGFRSLPPPRWARPVRSSAGPLGAAVLGLVLGLALLQVRTMQPRQLTLEDHMAQLHLREVAALQAPVTVPDTPAAGVQVAARLGVSRSGPRPLEPSVPALTPAWLPDGFDPDNGAPYLTGSATVQYFAAVRDGRPGIVVEVLRPDRSTVFQVKERHVFPVQSGPLFGLYIDGEWEVRGPRDEQPAPSTWRTDRSHSLLFSREGYLVLVAGPADVLDVDDLLRIARSLR